MIRIEPNTPNWALTNDQFCTIAGLIQQDAALDYDITEHDAPNSDIVWLYVYPEGALPVRHWIEIDGSVSLTEDCDWMEPTEGATP